MTYEEMRAIVGIALDGPLPGRTPSSTVRLIEEMMQHTKAHAQSRTWSKREVQYHVDTYGWAAYTTVSQAPVVVLLNLGRINSKRLLTAGDKLLPPCSHPDFDLVYDHGRCPYYKCGELPPREFLMGIIVAATCRTCNATFPMGPYVTFAIFGGIPAC